MIKSDYKLDVGSDFLKVLIWRQLSQRQLKSFIHRFATREAADLRKGKSSFYLWRVRRLHAAAIFDKRFGGVPEIFTLRKMPVLESYYVNNGVYIWPSLDLRKGDRLIRITSP